MPGAGTGPGGRKPRSRLETAGVAPELMAARLAAEQGREVFAIPGSIHSALSRGTRQLIREGAKRVAEAADVVGSCGIIL